MKRIFFIVVIMFAFEINQTNAQSHYPSPTAAGLGLYGSVPVNLSTGTPQIGIPIYELVEGDIRVPISLSYHSAGVKVNARPSWVGLGWSLMAGGQITRKVNGYPDELKGSLSAVYYDVDGDGDTNSSNESKAGPGYYYTHEWLNSVTKTNLGDFAEHYYTSTGTANFEITADEFNFNFMGYSGSFYMDADGYWQVSSEDQIKIEVGALLTSSVPRSGISDGPGPNRHSEHTQHFNSFTLITPDGFRYSFGGSSATEYTIPYRKQNTNFLVATTWYLNKIESPQGREVVFSYQNGSADCTMSLNQNQVDIEVIEEYTNGQWETVNNCATDYTGQYLTDYRMDGTVVFPVFLESIEALTTGTLIEIESSSLQHGYNEYEIGYDPSDLTWNTTLDGTYGYTQGPFYSRKLDDLTVKYKNVQEKKFVFDYHTYTAGTQRLKLKSLAEYSSIGSQPLPPHQFEYHAEAMPAYGSLSEYANDVDNEHPELLKEITYPTGGRSEFLFNKPTYQYEIGGNGTYLISQSGNTEGFVIQKISNYIGDTRIGTQGYSFSGGVLIKNWVENQDVYETFDDTNYRVKIDVDLTRNIMPFSFDGSDAPVGYSSATVFLTGENGDNNGDTDYTFTNFGTDLWGNSHFDESTGLGWHGLNIKGFTKNSSKAYRRGKILQKEIKQRSDGATIQEFKYHYNESTRNSDLTTVNLELLTFCNGGIVYFGELYDEYFRQYLLDRVEEYTYSNGEVLQSTTTYARNANNFITQINHSGNNPNESYITESTYPVYENTDPVVVNMYNKNILNVPLTEKRKFDDGTTVKTLSESKSNFITHSNGFPVISTVEEAPSGTSLQVTQSMISHDTYGNVLESKGRDNVHTSYIWGYKQTLPVAVIINATYSSVQTAIGTSNISSLNDNTLTDQQIRDKVTLLRDHASMSDARVTTYTYDPMKGMTSKTDPNGLVVYYEYDDFGRMTVVKDDDEDIVARNAYNYKSSFDVSLTSLAPSYTAGSTNVSVTANTTWSISTDEGNGPAGWLTANQSTAMGNGTITITYLANSGNYRTGTITVSGNGTTKTITVAQDK